MLILECSQGCYGRTAVSVTISLRNFVGEGIIKLQAQIGPGWLNELGSWITYQLIHAYHQYGVDSRPAL